jgi:hypothetical protein
MMMENGQGIHSQRRPDGSFLYRLDEGVKSWKVSRLVAASVIRDFTETLLGI